MINCDFLFSKKLINRNYYSYINSNIFFENRKDASLLHIIAAFNVDKLG